MDAQTSDTNTPNATTLLQDIRNWITTHLDIARVKATDGITKEQLLGSEHVPADGDEEFEGLFGLACVPNALDILENRGNPFHLMFRHMLLLKHRGGTTHSKSLLNSLVTDTIWETNAGQHFENPDVQMIAGFDDQRQLSIPLIVLAVVKESDYAKLPWPESPKALLLVATAYSRNPQLEYYDGFVVCLEGSYFYVSRLKASRRYMTSLLEGQGIDEHLLLYRSRKFDVFDCGDRREIVRMLVGVLRYLDGREQWKIPGDYQYVPLGPDSS